MNEQIVTLITDLVKQGGTTAMWLYGVYVLGAVLKYAIGFGCMVIAVNKITEVIRYGIDKEE